MKIIILDNQRSFEFETIEKAYEFMDMLKRDFGIDDFQVRVGKNGMEFESEWLNWSDTYYLKNSKKYKKIKLMIGSLSKELDIDIEDIIDCLNHDGWGYVE